IRSERAPTWRADLARRRRLARPPGPPRWLGGDDRGLTRGRVADLAPVCSAPCVLLLVPIPGFDQVTEVPVLGFVDLAPGESLVENPAGIAAWPETVVGPARPSDQHVNAPDHQTPEDEHARPSEERLPEHPVPPIPEHHRGHLPSLPIS